MLRTTAVLAAFFAPLVCACPAPTSAVQPAAQTLRSADPAPLVFRGPRGGPFVVAGGSTSSATLELENAPQTWSVRSNAEWLKVEKSAGSKVALTLDSKRVEDLAPGVHMAQVLVSRAENDRTPLRHFALLDVTAPEWTELAPRPDARVVYVSSSTGRDTNDGLSKDRPKKTIAAGKALVRHGKPDQLLLKRGDVWEESLGQWKTSGRSASEPTVIGAYGEGARPLLKTGADNGLFTSDGGNSPKRIEHLAIVGLHLIAHEYAGSGEPAGLSLLLGTTDVLVEDCKIERYHTNVLVQGYFGRHADFRLRRCVIVDAFNAGSAPSGHGLYVSNSDGILLEENVFDHNGWNESVPGAKPTIFRHNVYVQSGSGACTNVVARGNVFANAASHGLQMRTGGVAQDNLFADNSIALMMGGGNEPDPGGVAAVALRNVVLGGKDIDADNRRGWGIELANIAAGSVCQNIVAHRGAGRFPLPIDLHGNDKGIGVFDCALADNVVWDWGGPVLIQGDESRLGRIRFERNLFGDPTSDAPLLTFPPRAEGAVFSARNRFHSAKAPSSKWFAIGGATRGLDEWRKLTLDEGSQAGAPSLRAPERTLGDYAKSIGLATSASAFLEAAREQSRATWRPELTAAAVNAWIREGFTAR